MKSRWGRYWWFKISCVAVIFFKTIRGEGYPIIFCSFCAEFQKIDYISDLLLKNLPISKQRLVESDFGWGRYRWFQIIYVFRNFVTIEQLRCKFEFPKCLNSDFKHIGRCRMVIMFPKEFMIMIMSYIDWVMSILIWSSIQRRFPLEMFPPTSLW